MAKIYELADCYNELLTMLEEDEISPEAFKDTMDCVEGELSLKYDNICKFIRNLNSDVEGYKVELDKISKKKKALENKISWLKDYMLSNMQKMGREKIKTELFTVAVQKNGVPKLIVDDKIVPKKYFKKVVTITRDDSLIRESLAEGKKVRGCELVVGYQLRIK